MEESLDYQKTFVTIGNNLHTVRHAAKKTLEGVASDLNITHSALSKIENGRYPGLSLILLLKLCEYYNVSIEQVLDIGGSQIFNYSQNIHQPSGNHTLTNQVGDGYEMAIKSVKEENEYLRNQNQQLINTILNQQPK